MTTWSMGGRRGLSFVTSFVAGQNFVTTRVKKGGGVKKQLKSREGYIGPVCSVVRITRRPIIGLQLGPRREALTFHSAFSALVGIIIGYMLA